MTRRESGLRRAGLALLLAAAAVTLAPGASASTGTAPPRLASAASPAALAQPPTLPNPSSHGITLTQLAEVAFDSRLLDVTVTTQNVFRPGTNPTINPVVKPIKVRIYLPAGYDPDRATPYPVLYLLHGGANDWTAWSNDNEGDVRDIVNASDFRGIVVMPEGGLAGFYSNWQGDTDGRFRPQWEAFHVQQLVPWIDANLNTSGTRDGRAIAGLSMGGYGALRYAGRYTSLFSAVGSFSGGTDLREAGFQDIISDGMWQAGAAVGVQLWFNHGLTDGNYRVNRRLADGTVDPDECRQRPYRMDVVTGPASGRASINPIQMASAYNAYDSRIALYSGGVGDNDTVVDACTGQPRLTDEGLILQGNQAMHQALNQAGVEHRWCSGSGTHSWQYWRNDLANFLDYVYGDATNQCPNGWVPPG